MPLFYSLHELPPPEDADVLRVATLTAERVESLLKRRGLARTPIPTVAIAFARTNPVWQRSIRARCAAESRQDQTREIAS